MKTFLIATCCLAAAASSAFAQAGRNNIPVVSSRDSVKTAREAARVLEQAKAGSLADLQRKVQEEARGAQADELLKKAQESRPTQTPYAQQVEQAESAARLEGAMSRIDPEGRKLLAQTGNSPTMRAPDDSPVARAAVKTSPLSTDTPGPKPQPLRPTPLTEKEKNPPARTVIDAGTSFFDSRAGFGVFVEAVVVNHPQFHMTCDELQVFMDKAAEAADGSAPAGTTKPSTAGELAASGAAEKTATTADNDPSSRSNGSLKRAIAKGRKVIINKLSDKGEPQIGIGREADYDGKTGDIILRGWPQVQEGRNLTVATQPSTYFVIKANGQFKSYGPAQTRIIQADEKKGPKSAGVSPPAAAPGTSPAPVLNNRTQGGQ